MSRVSLCLLAVLAAVLASGCGSSGSSIPSGAAAVVGDLEISKDRIDLLMNQAKIVFRRTKKPFPKESSRSFEALRGRAVGYLVVGAMYESKAKDEGIVPSEAEIAAEVERTKKATYGDTPEKQQAAMKQEGMTDEELAEEARLKVVQNKVESKVLANVTVTDAEVKAAYEANKARVTTRASRVIRQILVDRKALADKLYGMLRAGSDFAALARKYSKDQPTARLGGRVEISQGQTSPAFDKVAFSIATGEISKPIGTQYGYQILQAIGPVKPAVVTPLSSVAESIKRQLLETKRAKVLGKWQLEAKDEFCGGKKIKYAEGYKPFPDDNPCRKSTSSTPAAG